MSDAREQTLDRLSRHPFDVLVIGGGIVGAAVARDAAQRGLATALIDQRDFAFGTSSRSSRLLHGGMRYLAQGRLGLVHEASVEKKILHEIAPHLAAPLPFVFPTYRGHKEWKLWQLKIGVKLYDLLCGGRNLGPSSWLGRDDVQAKAPGLREDGLAGGVRYFDGFTNDARLVLDTLRSAARYGAVVLNYARFTGATRGAEWTCAVKEALTGRGIAIRCRTVVNATGPWADKVPHSRVKLRLTKGVHLVVENSRLPVTETVVMTEGSRILFAIPWGGRTILGTTDTDDAGPPERVRVEATDVAYVLRITNAFFPAARLVTEDVLGAWAGLRPLIADPHGKPSDISRSHEITTPEPHWWDVAGGKLTTCRLMAEQTVDRLMKAAKLEGLPCRTHETPLLATPDEAAYSGLTPPTVSAAAVRHFCEHEWAVRLEDVMVRRAGWQHYGPRPRVIAEEVSHWMAAALGWDNARRGAELEALHSQYSPLP